MTMPGTGTALALGQRLLAVDTLTVTSGHRQRRRAIEHAYEVLDGGCITSPFILTKRDTLIVRNRYRRLKCYEDGARLPAYVAFRASLDLLFGLEEAARIVAHLVAGGGDLVAYMRPWAHDALASHKATRQVRA